MFLKNKNIIFKIRRSKVTDYAALTTKETADTYCVSIFVINESNARLSFLRVKLNYLNRRTNFIHQ